MQLKEKLKTILFKTQLTKDEIEELNNKTSFLKEPSSFPEQRFCYINDITEQPCCPICGKELHVKDVKKGFQTFCSRECRNTKRGKEILNQKTILTNQERYGTNWVLENDKIFEKVKETNLEKYGVENVFQSEEIKEKIKETNLEKYGKKSFTQTEEYLKKTKTTNIKKYGVNHTFQAEEVKQKIEKTNLERYGTKNPAKCDKVQSKMKMTQRTNYWEKFCFLLKNKYIQPLFDKDKYINSDSLLEYHCLKCDKQFTSEKVNPQNICCPYCKKSISNYEMEITTWLESLGIKNIKTSYRRKYELDIYLPDYNLGIEFHGLYWHSELFKDKNYHQDKWEYFNSQGIHVIQIFEHEWVNKPEIIKSIIQNQLGLNQSIYGRKCKIREITIKEYKNFLLINHLQEYSSAKVKLGLFHNDELVQVMSFGKSRFNKEYQWENIRTCTKVGYHVVGGFNKLLNYFKSEYSPDSIITYIDLRFFNGQGYIQSGFEELNVTKPKYYWWELNTLNVYNRFQTRKNKLKSLLLNYDENKTERENLHNSNYFQIFDAGNLVLFWSNN